MYQLTIKQTYISQSALTMNNFDEIQHKFYLW